MLEEPILHNGKLIYSALLASGIHKKKDLREIEITVIDPFQAKETRANICNRFRALLTELVKYKLDMLIWIDGSLCSLKPHPNDLDMVIFFDKNQIAVMDKELQNKLLSFLNNREELRARYCCDVFFEDKDDDKQVIYWRGLFSFDALSRPKGFIELMVKCDDNSLS